MSNKLKKIPTFGSFYKKKLGAKVYKVPIALSGFTCPNIDGTKAKGGCTFCENESFSPNYNKSKEKLYLSSFKANDLLLDRQIAELHEQFNKTTKALKKTHNVKKFIVYFQAFTNSYAPLETLKKLYEEALLLKAKALGPEHPDAANTLEILGSIYSSDKNYSQAEKFYF